MAVYRLQRPTPQENLPGRPIHGAAPQHVKMEMEHALACVFTHIGHQPPTPIYFHANPCRHPEKLTEELVIGPFDLGGRFDVTLGYHQNMGGSDGIDVVERQDVLGFSADARRDLTGDDRTEKAIVHKQPTGH